MGILYINSREFLTTHPNSMNKNTVMSFWAFDLNRQEDVFFLKQSQKYWNYFIAIVACNKNILKLKWRKPKHKESKRIKYVKKLWFADKVELADAEDCFSALKKYKPNVITLESNQLDLLYKLSEFLYENKLKTNVVTIDSIEIRNKKLLWKAKEYISKVILEKKI